jgi:hypothetical protein
LASQLPFLFRNINNALGHKQEREREREGEREEREKNIRAGEKRSHRRSGRHFILGERKAIIFL